MASNTFKTQNIFIIFCIAIFGCQSNQPAPEIKTNFPAVGPTEWYGVYASLAEHEGIEGQVLVLFESPLSSNDCGEYRMKAWTDYGISVKGEVNIRIDEVSGEFLTEGKHVYIPVPHGRTTDGKVTSLRAEIKRYTRVTINQETVLLAEHALERYEKGESLETTGVLIKLRLANDHYERFDMASLKNLPSENLIEKNP